MRRSTLATAFAFSVSAFVALTDVPPVADVDWSSGDLTQTGIPSGVGVTGYYVAIDQTTANLIAASATADVYAKALAGDYGATTAVAAKPDAISGEGLHADFTVANAGLPAYVLGLFVYERNGGTYALHAVGKYMWGSETPGIPSDNGYMQLAEAAVAGGARWVLVAGTPDDSGSDGSGSGDVVTPTLDPVPSASAYKVAFYANGGTGKMAKESFTYGKAKKLTANAFKRKNHAFMGWAKSKTRAKKYKVDYTNKQKVKNLSATGATVKLYAVWAKKSYKVVFYANDGMDAKEEQSFTYGKAKKLKACKFQRKGYSIKGWAKSKARAKRGTVDYANRKKVKNLTPKGGTVKLYAVWEKK